MRTILILAAAAGLAGCVSLSRSEAVSALAPDLARNARISEVIVTRAQTLKVTPAFDGIFKDRVSAKLAACAKGERPLRLEAHLERLDKANPVVTAVVAGSNVLRSTARLVDPATGQVVASYKVGKTIVGGRFAVVVMGEAEEQLSDAFGDELCAQAFPAPTAP